MTVPEENLGRQLFWVSKAHHKLASQTFERIGLCRGQPPVLFALAEQANMTQNELSEKLEVTAATMTNLLRRMETAGFITRLRDDQDKRVSRVTLTPFGREKLTQSQQLLEEMDQNAFAGFSAQEQADAEVYLTRIHANLTRCCKTHGSK